MTERSGYIFLFPLYSTPRTGNAGQLLTTTTTKRALFCLLFLTCFKRRCQHIECYSLEPSKSECSLDPRCDTFLPHHHANNDSRGFWTCSTGSLYLHVSAYSLWFSRPQPDRTRSTLLLQHKSSEQRKTRALERIPASHFSTLPQHIFKHDKSLCYSP